MPLVVTCPCGCTHHVETACPVCDVRRGPWLWPELLSAAAFATFALVSILVCKGRL